jgi:CheY-like chemotaxis protein/HPt (histidine-containing phosphotransfer) domain-containing protein
VRVLVIDDNAASRAALQALLQTWGAQVNGCNSGPEALALLCNDNAEQPFDIALIDQGMPQMDGIKLGRFIHSDPDLHYLPCILLTDKRQPDQQTLQAAGFTAVVAKPVRMNPLRDAVLNTLNIASANEAEADPSDAAPPEISARVLLAEDNMINQQVAKGFLEKSGCEVVVAVNGRDAVYAYEESQFDLVFMDCQMPILDGYAATREIRRLEAISNSERTPIIAMTANAMQGDREECLAAGMDDHMTKPINLTVLSAMLSEWLPAHRISRALTRPGQERGGKADAQDISLNGHFNPAVIAEMQATLGAPAVHEMVETFIHTTQQLIHNLQQALETGDYKKMHFAAHSLKGSSGNMGAVSLSTLSRRLDQLVSNQAAAQQIQQLLNDVSSEFKALKHSVKRAG